MSGLPKLESNKGSMCVAMFVASCSIFLRCLPQATRCGYYAVTFHLATSPGSRPLLYCVTDNALIFSKPLFKLLRVLRLYYCKEILITVESFDVEINDP